MLKAWENFLLDFDLENAKLLNPILPEKYKGITVLTNRLLDKANLDWETNFNQDASFKWLIEKLPSTESLSDKDLAYKKNEVLQHAYTSHQPPPPKETTRKLSTAHLNKNKWAYNVLDKAPDPELFNKAFEYELNALYQKTKKLKKINKSFIDFSISDKFLVLHTTLYQAYSDALARNPHSPKVDQYRALIGKLEKEAKWYVEKTNNPKEKKIISEPRELHSKYLIQHNRTNQLLEFQRKFNSPSDSSIRSILTQARTDMNQFRSTFYLTIY